MAGSRTALGLLVLLPGGLVLTSALATGGRRLLTGSANHGGDPAAAVAGLASVAAAAITAWLTLCLLLALAAELPGAAGAAAGRVRDRITPVLVRQWAAVVLGASVTATLLPGTAVAAVRAATEPAPGLEPTDVPADAPSPGWAPGPWPVPTTLPASGFSPGTPRTTVPPPTSAPAPGWTPRRPVVRQRADPGLLTGRQRATESEESVVIRRGDTLWSIAAAHLGPGATDAEVAAAWPRWHSTNRTTIGADPHLLTPGTRLTPPSTA